jgi:hypothetical protein
MKDVLEKISGEINACVKLTHAIKAKGFNVPSDLTARKEELIFAAERISGTYGYDHTPFAIYWSEEKVVLDKFKIWQYDYMRTHGCISVPHDIRIKACERVLKILETMFPEEVKAFEVPPTAAVTITAETVATWLQSNPTNAEITNVLSTIRGNASDLYEEFIKLDIKRAHRELIEGIQALLNKQ